MHFIGAQKPHVLENTEGRSFDPKHGAQDDGVRSVFPHPLKPRATSVVVAVESNWNCDALHWRRRMPRAIKYCLSPYKQNKFRNLRAPTGAITLINETNEFFLKSL
jgi:hypothetical protein